VKSARDKDIGAFVPHLEELFDDPTVGTFARGAVAVYYVQQGSTDRLRSLIDEGGPSAMRERAFKVAQLEAARAREQAARRVARRTLAGLVAATVLAMVASAAGGVAHVQLEEAKNNTVMARQSAAMAERHAATTEEERRQAVVRQKEVEAQSQKAREAVQVVQILYSQTKSDAARSREDRDREVYAGLQREAKEGNATAMRYLGLLTFYGQGAAKDEVQARDWWEKASAVGDVAALADVGWLHAKGKTVPKNIAKALEIYGQAASQGDPFAMAGIAYLYQQGDGVPRDDAKAREWYEKAAAAGNTAAMRSIGLLYVNGQGVPRDYNRAREWYEKAAAAGDRSALGQLSWHALLSREFTQALDTAERALKADPELLWIATNRAHALMFLGKAAEAREVYQVHRDKRIPQNADKTWQHAIAEGFDELRRAGLNHLQMAEIEAALGISGR
jgi:TPR repeat protein